MLFRSFIVMGLMSVQWVLWGYSLAFGAVDSEANMFMGNLDYMGFNQVSHWAPLGEPGSCEGTWSDYYQMQQMKGEGAMCSQGWPGTVPHQMFLILDQTWLFPDLCVRQSIVIQTCQITKQMVHLVEFYTMTMVKYLS